MGTPPNVRELLRRHAEIIDELRAIGVLRSKNNPVADYAEWLTAAGLSLSLAPKSTKGYDALDSKGLRYEVKARRVTPDNGSRQCSAIRGLQDRHFDYLVGVLFESDFTIRRAACIPWQLVLELATYREHTNAHVFFLRDEVWTLTGVRDVTQALSTAQST